MRLLTYSEFYKLFVQRKKQELMEPNFIGVSEIVMPKQALVHFVPKLATEYGPSTSEAFISNFPEDVFIDFVPRFTPVMGHGRALPFDLKKAIQAYRASHYTYNWTKDINTVYRRNDVLVVKNYGVADKTWAQRAATFVNFEIHYNRLSMLMDGINEEAGRPQTRKQFLRLELPLNVPSYKELMVDYEKYIGSFKDGLPVPSNQVLRVTKGEGSYWLLDLLAFLQGEYEYTQFGKLTPQAEDDLHLIFTANSKALIIHVKTIKTWLDELNAKLKEGETPTEVSPKRLNVTKRFYLALMNLSRGSVSEKEITGEEKKDGPGSGDTGTQEDNSSVDQGETGAAQGQGRTSGKGEASSTAGQNAPVDDHSADRSILDVFSSDAGNHGALVEGQGDEAEHPIDETAGDWTSNVDDTLLETETTSMEISTNKDAFPTPESGIKAALEERARDGGLTVSEQAFFMRKGSAYQHIEMENGQSLAEFMQISQAEIDSLDGKIEGNFITVLDESMLRSRSAVLKQDYAERFLHKDIAKMFVGMQNAGIALADYKQEVISGVEGSYDVFRVQFHPVDGGQSSHQIRLPKVQKDGSFTVDGVKQHMQLQRMELPIRKINAFKVALTSYYDRKLMVLRSQKVVDDYGLWLVKQIRGKGETGALTYSLGSSYNPEFASPRIHSILAKKFKFIEVGGFTLDFRINELLEKHPEFKKFTRKDAFLVGVKDAQPLWVDSYGNLFQGDREVNTVEGLMGVSMTKAPIEYAVINISGFFFPIGVVLCYYFGIDKLIQVTKATTRSIPMGTRPKLGEDEYAIAFNDEYLIFNRREKLPSLIFGGMPKLNNIGNFSRTDLNEKGIWVPLMGDPKVKPQQFKEMKNLFDLFIDPITKEELARLGYATSFHYLLIDAVKLLETDFSRHEVEIDEQRIVGYERFAGHVYREMVKAVRMYRNKGKERKHTIDLNPEAVILNIITDTSVNLVEEVNPIHQLKDQEEVTFGGVGGRSEITMVKRARQQLDTYKGIISEANKDSGKVGFVTYLSSDPRIKDFRGNIAKDEKGTTSGLVSVTGNLQYGVGHDD